MIAVFLSSTMDNNILLNIWHGYTVNAGEAVKRSRRLPLSPSRRKRGSQAGNLRCHEGIAAADVAAEVLRWITIHELTAKHGMGHTTDFMLNGEQLAACLRMDKIGRAHV